MKKIILLLIIIILTITFFFIKYNLIFEITPKEELENEAINNQEINQVVINNKIIKIEIADDPEEWRRGLSYRENLCDNCGMLFVYPDKKVRSFWMKDMNFPIDIIWIDDNEIVKIDKDLKPEGKFPKNHYSSDNPVDYVLEVNANYTEKNNINVNDRVEINI